MQTSLTARLGDYNSKVYDITSGDDEEEELVTLLRKLFKSKNKDKPSAKGIGGLITTDIGTSTLATKPTDDFDFGDLDDPNTPEYQRFEACLPRDYKQLLKL